MIAAGKLRHRVELQEKRQVQNGTTGALATTWEAVGTVWAEVAPLSGREYVAAQAVSSQITTRITIRWRAGVTAAHRIVHAGQVYDVEAVLPDAVSGREYLTLMCRSGVSSG